MLDKIKECIRLTANKTLRFEIDPTTGKKGSKRFPCLFMQSLWVLIISMLWIYQGGGSYAFIWAGLPGFLPLYFFQNLSHRLFFLLGSIMCFLIISCLSKTVIKLKVFKVWLVFFFLLSAISILYNFLTVDSYYKAWKRSSEYAIGHSQAYEFGDTDEPYPSKRTYYKIQVIPYSFTAAALSFYLAQIIAIITGLIIAGISKTKRRKIIHE